MHPVINAMKRMGLPVIEDGMCNGLAITGMQAYLLGAIEYEGYSVRLKNVMLPEVERALDSAGLKEITLSELVECYGTEEAVPSFLLEVLESRSISVEENRASDWDIQAFLQGVALYGLPHEFPALFPANRPLPTQFDVEEIAAITQSCLTQERLGIRKVDAFCGLYKDDEEIKKYLNSYRQAVVEKIAPVNAETSRCALLLRSHSHTTMLAYDVHSGWCLQNNAKIHKFQESDTPSLIKQLKELYGASMSDDPLILSTAVYSLGDASSVAKSVCQSWRDHVDWQLIHTVTPEKAKVERYGGWLYVAAWHSHLDEVKALIEAGANVNATTVDKSTVLHVAVAADNPVIIKTLIKAEADPNAMTKNRATPLHFAASYGRPAAAEILIKAGADPMAKTTQGMIPLCLAAEMGYIDVAAVLLKPRPAPRSSQSHSAEEQAKKNASALKNEETATAINLLKKQEAIASAQFRTEVNNTVASSRVMQSSSAYRSRLFANSIQETGESNKKASEKKMLEEKRWRH